MKDEKENLLQEIQCLAGQPYLSDLHLIPFSEDTEKLILEIPNDKYSIDEWKKAASYITDTFCEFEDISRIKEGIIFDKRESWNNRGETFEPNANK